VRASSVEFSVDGEPPQQATPCPWGLVAAVRHAAARTASLGPARPRVDRLRGLLRVHLLSRLGGRPGGGGARGRAPLHLRGGRVRLTHRAARGRDRPHHAPGAAQHASVQDGGALPGRGADARLRRRLARARPGRHAARRLPRQRLPRASRRPVRRVALLGLEQALLGRRLAHPVRVPPDRRDPAPHGRLDRRTRGRHACLRRWYRGADAAHGQHPQLAHRPAAPDHREACARQRVRVARATGARGSRAGGARHARGGAGARRRGPLPGPVRGRGARRGHDRGAGARSRARGGGRGRARGDRVR
jgi:hypothetical protein